MSIALTLNNKRAGEQERCSPEGQKNCCEERAYADHAAIDLGESENGKRFLGLGESTIDPCHPSSLP